MVPIEIVEKELKSGKLHGIYLFYGEEMFLIENAVKKVKTQFGETIKGINFISIDDDNIQGLISDIETPAFGYEKKLIIARNTNILKREGKRKNADVVRVREKLDEYIKENEELINQSVVLVFIEEDVDSRFALYKTIDKCGVVCKADFQKPIQLERRIITICNGYQVNIDNQTVKYFIETCGTSMQDLINEIRKLIEYAGPGGKIQKEDIDLLAVKKLESVIFDLTDSLGKKDTKSALDVLHALIYNKEPTQKILINLYNHFKKIYFTKIALKNNRDLVTSLNLKPNQTFLTGKYKMQAGYFNERELKKILQELRDLDYNYKNGLIDLNVGLETILCRYCS